VHSTLQLADWETFYVILGSSAAALIGLQFVVVALSADRQQTLRADEVAVRAFGTPTIVHLGVVLLLAAFITIPHQTVLSLHLSVVATAAFGMFYVARAFVLARRQTSYKPVWSDWMWHIALPFASYLHLLVAGFSVAHETDTALYGIGGTAIVLLFIGIHNAWDSAVYVATERR
jgi:hypothetical protein